MFTVTQQWTTKYKVMGNMYSTCIEWLRVPCVKLIIPTVARADLAYWLASATIQLERRIPLIAVATKNGATVCGKT